MKIIKKLSERIEDEIKDSKMYAKWAVEMKEERRSLADALYALSLDEMKHAMTLHGEVTAIISEYRAEHGEPPEAMLAVYNYLHERQMEKCNEAKNYQSMYREA